MDEVPCVALESTVISHGLPYPRNIELAFDVENTILQCGAKPVTCGVLNGKLVAGLSKEAITLLGSASEHSDNVYKISRRDIPVAMAKRRSGGTTVSATMIIASSNAIEVFATGGIGGVHRDWKSTFDVSADLEELSTTPCIVVCAGAKAILDIPATMEYLETKGVTVVGYMTDYVPAFYSRRTSNNLRVPERCDSAAEVADIWMAKQQAGMAGGLLVMNPIPDTAEIPYEEIEIYIQTALDEVRVNGITGPAVTPYLLAALDRLTVSRSVEANIALLHNNARLGAEIALALTERRKEHNK
jgi:pseudouridylate synthase